MAEASGLSPVKSEFESQGEHHYKRGNMKAEILQEAEKIYTFFHEQLGFPLEDIYFTSGNQHTTFNAGLVWVTFHGEDYDKPHKWLYLVGDTEAWKEGIGAWPGYMRHEDTPDTEAFLASLWDAIEEFNWMADK